MKSTTAPGRKIGLLSPAIFVIAIACLELATRKEILPPLFFPPPSVVAKTLYRMMATGELAGHLGATVGRLLTGFVAGGLPGMILGLLMGWSSGVRRVLDPFVAAFHPVPKISSLPIIMIIFGIGLLSKTIVIAVAAFFPMLINSMSGVREIHPIYFEAAANCGAGKWQLLRRVILPGSLPFVLAGVRLGLNSALSLSLAVELLLADRGIGAMIWMAWQTLRIEELYASIVTAAAVGIAIRLTVVLLLHRFVPWHANTRS